jgi:hypothetical protein
MAGVRRRLSCLISLLLASQTEPDALIAATRSALRRVCRETFAPPRAETRFLSSTSVVGPAVTHPLRADSTPGRGRSLLRLGPRRRWDRNGDVEVLRRRRHCERFATHWSVSAREG